MPHVQLYAITLLNPFTPKSDFIDLSNTRQFYSSKGDPLDVKGLKELHVQMVHVSWFKIAWSNQMVDATRLLWPSNDCLPTVHILSHIVRYS